MLLRRGDPRWKAWATQAVLFGLMFGFAVQVANNAAHIGGVVLGVACGLWLGAGQRRPPARWQVALAGLGMAGSVVSLVLAQLSPLWRLVEEALAK
jgi:rhomboid protease GluP